MFSLELQEERCVTMCIAYASWEVRRKPDMILFPKVGGNHISHFENGEGANPKGISANLFSHCVKLFRGQLLYTFLRPVAD